MTIPILMYHQIDTPPARGTPLRGLVVSPNSFARQMVLLKLLGFKGLSMRDLEPYLKGEKKGKVVGVTFDDGYQNILINALPILKKLGFTATSYAVSNMLGGSNSWDHKKGIHPKSLMTINEWKVWINAGMDVGSHTRNHVDLTELSNDQCKDEIQVSRLELNRILNYEVKHFCYPYGRFNNGHKKMVLDSGYVTATTTQRGRARSGDDPLSLRRALISQATHLIQFSFKILSSYEDKRG